MRKTWIHLHYAVGKRQRERETRDVIKLSEETYRLCMISHPYTDLSHFFTSLASPSLKETKEHLKICNKMLLINNVMR